MQIGGRTYNVKLGLTIFLCISVASAVVIIYRGMDERTWTALRHMRPQFVLFAAALMVGQWLLNALRFQILVNSFERRVSFMTSFKAFMANVFLAAMTPSQTGGGPLQIYILNRAGLPVARAFAGCLVGAVLTVICLIVSNLVVLGLSADFRLGMGPHVGTVFTVALAVFLALAGLFLVSLARIAWLKRAAGWLVAAFSRLGRARPRYSVVKRLFRGLDQYRESMLAFAGSKKRRVVAAGIITMLAMSTNALIAPVLVAGLSAGGNALKIFLLQFVILFIAYFSPTPGASGIAEFSSYWLMASVSVQGNLLGVYTVMWRFYTSFLGVGVGATVVLSMLGRWRHAEEPVSRGEAAV
ncbi:MAG TPA: flippase-like domain-containing protein [bacterium]|nr:flippase-like domain-containing protein [bacterium]